MSLEALYAPIAADMQAVDAVIRARLHSEVVLIRQVAEYIIGAGGKRLRPALVLFSAGALGYRGSHHRELAAVVDNCANHPVLIHCMSGNRVGALLALKAPPTPLDASDALAIAICHFHHCA